MEDKSCREVWREKECHIYWRSLQEDGLRASSQSEVWLQPGGSCLLQQSFSDLQVDFSFWDFKQISILFECFFSRDKYNDKHIKVIFLAVSDDDKWIKAGEDLSPTFSRDIFRPTLENIQT